MPGLGLSLTAVDSGLLSPLIPGQTKLSWFLLAPDGDSVAGTGVILPYTSSGMYALPSPLPKIIHQFLYSFRWPPTICQGAVSLLPYITVSIPGYFTSHYSPSIHHCFKHSIYHVKIIARVSSRYEARFKQTPKQRMPVGLLNKTNS